MFGKIRAFAVAHKAISTILALVIVGAGYSLYKKATTAAPPTKYVLATAAKGTLISSVSGSGQVSADNDVTVSSTVSGNITSIDVVNGQTVKKGQLLATIDSTDAAQAVTNAKLSLQNAQIAYQKAVEDASIQSASSSSSDLVKAYQSGYNAIVAAAVDLPDIFATMDDIYYTTSHSEYFSDTNVVMEAGSEAASYKAQAGAELDAAKSEYDANFQNFKNISLNSSQADVYSLLNETNTILNKLLSALSSTYSTLDYIQNHVDNVPAQLTADKTTVSSYVTKVNSDSTSVTNAIASIATAQSSGTGADLSVQQAALTVSQDQANLTSAEETLADHSIIAPFDGIVASVAVKPGDTASSGTQIATVITAQDVVDISLNEVDAAKVATSDKVSLTFDAIDGLTLTGHVSNVDLVGTVSQGVVTYNVEITLDDSDARVKPGMTANANIITDVKQDALLVPSSAVKTQGSTSYVQELSQKYDPATAAQGVASAAAPVAVPVTIGASNDSQVEITSGLNEGDQVITRTVTGSAASTSGTPSILNSLGGARTGGAAGGGAVRFTRGG
ncbi:MAG: efflux RND transporter periplasmic adaptor subunit [Patescibacteria group bacterium]|nr:efflux RND transporter periplasmic adaptor subunit [Patescibacteria group bacterium]MDE2116296.1 efflux RND transporter periplasmic adaptor subunit [Patescibacteria group bacterium]